MLMSGHALLTSAVLLALISQAWADESATADSRRSENEQLFRTLDKNADGELTADEFDDSRRTYFERLIRSSDVNNDGKLVRAEFLSGIEGRELKPVTGVQPISGQSPRGRTQGTAQEFFKRLDRNGDKKLSLNEFPETMRDRVKGVMDRLNVDALTFDQISKLRSADAAGRLPQSARDQGKPEKTRAVGDRSDTKGGATVSRPSRDGLTPKSRPGAANMNSARGGLLQMIDGDRDGRVTREEWERLEGLFSRIDRNGDGVLDPSELSAFGSRMKGAGGSGIPTGRPSPATKQPDQPAAGSQMVQAYVKRLDQDKDGRISESEASRLPSETFKRIDINGDGFLTPDELGKARASRSRK